MPASGTADIVDAIVIVTAVRHQAPVVASDPGDLTRIADSIGVEDPAVPNLTTTRSGIENLLCRTDRGASSRTPGPLAVRVPESLVSNDD